MRLSISILMALTLMAGCTSPKPQYGSIDSIKDFNSEFVDKRQVDIWLPDGFEPDKDQKYAVLYMHDGQNLFDTRYGYNGQIWAADVSMQHLIDAGKVPPAIIVGIWNTPKRFEEYLPAPAFKGLTAYQQYLIKGERNGVTRSDEYLQFIVSELKPYIDSHYPTHTGPEHTFISGSSMGGLISAYALAAYPKVFGGAACLSTHWPLSLESNDTAFSRPFMLYLAQNLPAPGSHKIYFDFGTETLDARYELHQHVMDSVMQSMGYEQGLNWMTRKFEGDAHNEDAWRKRFTVPLKFLMGK
jgi:predicted alpha/beta superfamily hydrolase